MGYGYYILPTGREAGYLVEAVCDLPACREEIDRGMDYLCGELPILCTGPGCGGYFCPDHLDKHDCPRPACGVYPCPNCEDEYNGPCTLLVGHAKGHEGPDGDGFEYDEDCDDCS